MTQVLKFVRQMFEALLTSERKQEKDSVWNMEQLREA